MAAAGALDWDLLSRAAKETWGLDFAAPQEEAARRVEMPSVRAPAEGSSLVAGTPRLVLLSDVRVLQPAQLAWVFAWWPVERKGTSLVRVNVLSASGATELQHFWFSLPLIFPSGVRFGPL